MRNLYRQPLFWMISALCAALLAGCSSRSLNRAPVEDRTSASAPADSGAGAQTVAPKPAPGAENAGKPGYYTVKPGDTLIRIALEHGQAMQDIARWSQVDNPNRIEVGQVLRVVPPAVANEVVIKPIAKPGVVVAAPAGAASAPAAAASGTPSGPVTVARVPDGEINLLWPSGGTVLAGFDEVKNKGLDIGGAAGDPVLAAAAGRVVYVGAGLRGYGNLIILKHDNTYLTAYAHNRTLLVKEDQTVAQGQKIAEMGNSDADRVKLHFEVRRQGKPVDPLKYLPAR